MVFAPASQAQPSALLDCLLGDSAALGLIPVAPSQALQATVGNTTLLLFQQTNIEISRKRLQPILAAAPAL